MKQRIDFNQAKQLWDEKVIIQYPEKYFDKDGWCAGLTLRSEYPAATIGEMIAWIEGSTDYCITIVREIGAWSISTGHLGKLESFQTELIDALVELALKIKEETK